jgi:arylsulfatase A-like enzyme
MRATCSAPCCACPWCCAFRGPSSRCASRRPRAISTDIAPTLLDLVGVPIPDTFEGRTLVPQIVGAEEGGDAPNFAALGAPLYPDASIQHSLRVGDWTYARNIEPDDPAEFLYDRSIDPREDVDLAAREPTELARMRDQLDAHLAGGSREEVLETGVRIDPKIEQRLRAMGYLQ